jgi:hypothetical protein
MTLEQQLAQQAAKGAAIRANMASRSNALRTHADDAVNAMTAASILKPDCRARLQTARKRSIEASHKATLRTSVAQDPDAPIMPSLVAHVKATRKSNG